MKLYEYLQQELPNLKVHIYTNDRGRLQKIFSGYTWDGATNKTTLEYREHEVDRVFRRSDNPLERKIYLKEANDDER